MITLYPVRIEAVDETGEPLFHLETFDEHNCQLKMHGLIKPSNLDEVLAAIRRGVMMLDLERSEPAGDA